MFETVIFVFKIRILKLQDFVPVKFKWLLYFCSADAFYDSSYSTDFRIQVTFDGTMDWAFGGIFKTSCELDLTYFPFDVQTCNLTLENWAYNGYQVCNNNN